MGLRDTLLAAWPQISRSWGQQAAPGTVLWPWQRCESSSQPDRSGYCHFLLILLASPVRDLTRVKGQSLLFWKELQNCRAKGEARGGEEALG